MGGSSRAARRHAGLPAARGAAQVDAPERRRGPVGRRRRACHRAGQQVSSAPQHQNRDRHAGLPAARCAAQVDAPERRRQPVGRRRRARHRAGQQVSSAPQHQHSARHAWIRPPEVLLKWTRQSATVDLWAAGVVLATVLANRYPFFRAADDYSALAEVADLLGTDAVQRTAEALGRRVVTSTRRAGLCLRKLSARLRRVPPAPPVSAAPRAGTCAGCQLARDLCLCPDENVPASSFDPDLVVAGFPDSAFALAARLLEPNPSLRITADEALKHPFLATED
ncbi:unnamed protein product [Parnassius apollo]|uniref:(apollo) hypothetical protein n=1 Tax=Parnassius apollo TaxID=110799 RepID=A0A8S3XMV5_PARAO|nr:unnamed protein product [Parnassius apollo]